jgi:hypothetical protein
MSNLNHPWDLIQDTSTRPLTAAPGSSFSISLAISCLGHAAPVLTDHRIELFPLFACREKLVLMASHEDVRFWTRQNREWFFAWLRETEDRPVGTIEGNHSVLVLFSVAQVR